MGLFLMHWKFAAKKSLKRGKKKKKKTSPKREREREKKKMAATVCPTGSFCDKLAASGKGDSSSSSSACSLDSNRWTWVREDAQGWKMDEARGCLCIKTQAGSIWGVFGRSNPASNTLIAPAPAVKPSSSSSSSGDGEEGSAAAAVAAAAAAAVAPFSFSVGVSLTITSWGEQAGLVLYADDDNWIKLVLEGARDGSTVALLGVSAAGQPSVVAKVPWPAQTSASWTTLKLSVDPASAKVTATAAAAGGDGDSGGAAAAAVEVGATALDTSLSYSLGLMAHGSKEDVKDAHFKDFELKVEGDSL